MSILLRAVVTKLKTATDAAWVRCPVEEEERMCTSATKVSSKNESDVIEVSKLKPIKRKRRASPRIISTVTVTKLSEIWTLPDYVWHAPGV